MDIYTKIFLANIVTMFFMAWFDRLVLNDAIQNFDILGELFGLWALMSILSIPVWAIYFIATW